MNKQKQKKRTIPFDPKLSAELDRATLDAERGKPSGVVRKRWMEWLIFGGKV